MQSLEYTTTVSSSVAIYFIYHYKTVVSAQFSWHGPVGHSTTEPVKTTYQMINTTGILNYSNWQQPLIDGPKW